jgi:molybdopterin-guanine dinucleotide biosynthesis protein A
VTTRAAGAVLCGGRSQRFGRDKALVDAGGDRLGQRVVEALRCGGADPVVAVGGTAGAVLAVPTINDRWPGAGPLAALATVLLWARDGAVVVVACDLPLLTGEHVSDLIDAWEPGRAAVAVVDGRPEPSVACWPASAGPALRRAVVSGERAWSHALDVCDWSGVALGRQAVADADTPAELASLLRSGDPVARTNPPELI